MTAAEKLALDNDEGSEQYYEHSARNQTFRSRIPRLSGQRPPLKSVTNQTAPYFIPTFHDIKQFNEPSESDNKQEIHYHFHYHF
ncbi:16313_t:CDS:2 [Gigaspora margarita]|uniref:16313_t:CDS:1 n=1 Tax=Gigaspora margarita TaxID=4874 RepID=A0ABN7UKZ1_GIGMA|nr:16313_t:CDS:2 [Gigaspora margarita]